MLLATLLPLLLLAQDVATFRSEVRYIRVDAQVLKGSQPVIDLKRDDFHILDEGVAQPITNFASEDVPLDIILLLDVSSSTTPIEQEIKDFRLRRPEASTAGRSRRRRVVLLVHSTGARANIRQSGHRSGDPRDRLGSRRHGVEPTTRCARPATCRCDRGRTRDER